MEKDETGQAVEGSVAETPVPDGTSQEGTSQREAPASNKPERAALEASVQSKLDALDFTGDGSDPEPDADPSADPPATEPDGGSEPEAKGSEGEGQPAQEVEETPAEGEQVSEEQPKSEAKPKTGPTLPAAYVRSLKAYDWTDEEIEKAFKADPANFTVTAQKIHKNRSDEVAKWADIGRAIKEQSTAQKSDPKPQASPHLDPKTGGFKPLDVDAMVEKYGNEEIVREIVAPVNEVLAAVNSILPDLLTGVSTIRQSRQETMARQVDQFFGQKELEPFASVYGKDFDTADEEQIGNRNKVLEVADALLAGAAQQGRKLTTTDALTMAHDHVSSGFKKDTAIKEVKQQVQKRSASITLKPSKTGTKTTATSGKPKNARDMEARTLTRLQAAFGG